MRRYNALRPVMLIAVALLTNSLFTNLCAMFGMSPESASNVGFIAMMIAALVMYNRMTKHRRK
ncbi:hypothetical protein SAMN05661091_5684 [Paenibacillus uliginis N3/975]|uniref:Uncharacterized protein n=1 Tax=Paenibacillus uliginis N3/975 TaxID=1313296 RepID=A0A1X7HSJ2_9BACL|nr:hypothetical protein [Paenibacillus uliginis]SMF92107.1 hypothetical protein SAMN05661091_5684 [Paenibacillus uliginis N3/975]